MSEVRQHNKQARDMLISEKMSEVNKVIARHFPRYINDDDVFQVGCMGLIRGIDQFSDSTYHTGYFGLQIQANIQREIERYLKCDSEPRCCSLNVVLPICFINDSQYMDRDMIDKAVRKLSAREEFVILGRFFMNMSKSDMARECEVSVARIGQLESSALSKLQHLLRKQV